MNLERVTESVKRRGRRPRGQVSSRMCRKVWRSDAATARPGCPAVRRAFVVGRRCRSRNISGGAAHSPV